MLQNHSAAPQSLEELKAFVKQFLTLLPEEKRAMIEQTMAQLETPGGIQNDAQAQAILMQLMQGLGL